MTRIVLPVAPDPTKSPDVQTWQSSVQSWGNDVKGKLETYSRAVSAGIDSTPIGVNAPSTGAFTTLKVTGATNISGLVLTGAITATTLALSGALTATTGTFSGAITGASFAGAVGATNLSASGVVSGPGFSSYLGSPPAIGGTAAAAGKFTTLTTTGANSLTLTNGTSNLISFGTNGLGTPTNTTRSVGTKIVLYDDLSGTTSDYALGVASGILWQSLPQASGTSFAWYADTSQVATLTGVGVLGISGAIQAGTGASGGGYQCKAGATGGFSTNAYNLYWTGGTVQLWIDATNIGTINVTSDERWKHSIETLQDNATDQIAKLRPVSYRFSNKDIFRDDGRPRVGFIAQEVEQIIPSAVEDGDPKTLNLLPLIAVSAKAIQELHERVSALEATIKEKT